MTETITLGVDAAGFNIGRVIKTTFAVLGRNFLPFALIAIVIGLPYIAIYFHFGGFAGIRAGADRGQIIARYVVMMGVSVFTHSMTGAALSYGTFQDLSGRRTSLGGCVAGGFAMLPRVVVAGLIYTLLAIVGLALFVVPGLMFVTMLWVLVPVIVVEHPGLLASFGRSRTLTRGRRWGIFGLLTLVFVVQQVVAVVFGAVVGFAVTVSKGPGLETFVTIQEWARIAGLVVGLLSVMFFSVMSAVGYYYLRAEKEGIAIGDIARVFD